PRGLIRGRRNYPAHAMLAPRNDLYLADERGKVNPPNPPSSPRGSIDPRAHGGHVSTFCPLKTRREIGEVRAMQGGFHSVPSVSPTSTASKGTWNLSFLPTKPLFSR